MADFTFESTPTILSYLNVFLDTGVKEQYDIGDVTLT